MIVGVTPFGVPDVVLTLAIQGFTPLPVLCRPFWAAHFLIPRQSFSPNSTNIFYLCLCRAQNFCRCATYIKASPDACFWFLKRRKFQNGSKTMQKTMLRVWYKHSVGVHWGNFVPAHFCGLYTRNVDISLLVKPMVFLHHKNGRVRVQIPTFFVCGRRITD